MRQPLWNSTLWPWSIFLTFISAIISMVSTSNLEKITSHAIIAWELAGSGAQSGKLMTAWGPEGLRLAGFCLGIDFLFIAAYVTAISLACLWARDGFEENGWPLAGMGLVLSIAMIVAGVFDSIENYALLQQLLHGADDSWAFTARMLALAKFFIVILSLAFSSLGAIAQRKAVFGLILGIITVLVARPVWTFL